MLEEAPPNIDDKIEIDGEPFEEVVIVGRIIEIQHQNMRTIFHITDNTSSSKVIFYQKGENEVPTALKDFQ
jgi:RecJ-like exonuclease